MGLNYEKPDPFVYCPADEMGHVTYYRMMRAELEERPGNVLQKSVAKMKMVSSLLIVYKNDLFLTDVKDRSFFDHIAAEIKSFLHLHYRIVE